MKKIIFFAVIVITLTLFVMPVMAAKPSTNGFDEFGYNYTARIFNGTGASWCAKKYGWPNSDCLGIYSPDKLVMKWNAEWDRGNEENWLKPPYGAWEDNEWNGLGNTGGSGEIWHYKIIWVGPAKWDISGTWNLDFVIGEHYLHTMNITSYDWSTGNFSGTGTYNSNNSYTWTVTGNVNSTNVIFDILYTGTSAGYTVHAEGILSGNTIIGTWSSNAGQTGTWSGSGTPASNNGPYWRDGGYRIWGQFETIMDQGKDPNFGPGHLWFTHAIPNGYGVH